MGPFFGERGGGGEEGGGANQDRVQILGSLYADCELVECKVEGQQAELSSGGSQGAECLGLD